MPKIIQLKIFLTNVVPIVWRRFLVKDSDSFYKLHQVIQIVMGWENYHLYEFNGKNFRIGEPDEEFDANLTNSKKSKLKDFLVLKQNFGYVYDFGDTWEHTILVEKFLEKQKGQKYPLCIEGQRACPPEDCGGFMGYDELTKIMSNKKHRYYKERLEWLGGKFDPENFDLKKINRKLLKLTH